MPGSPRRRNRQFRPPRHIRRNCQTATEAQLRRLFNDGGILEKAESGEFTVKLLKDAHPSPPMADEPECTKSQLLAYIGPDGKKIAEAHQYLRTDGTIGASGVPDPKEVLHKGIVYYLDKP